METTTENNEASLSTIKGRHSRGKTGKEKSSGTKCRENGLEDENVGNTNEMNELKAVKTTVEEKSERIKKATEKQEQVSGRKEDGFQKNECIKINKTQEEFSDCLANEGRNNDTCIGTSPALNDHSSPQILLAKEQDSIVERQETGNITGKVSQKATVTSQKANTEPGVGHTNMCPKVGNEQKSSERCSQQKQKDEGEIMFNISTDPSRRTSSRLATLCNRNTAQPEDKERNVQKRDVKFAEKVNLNVSENSRLRSRALIKQPGHENRYCKGHQSKRK